MPASFRRRHSMFVFLRHEEVPPAFDDTSEEDTIVQQRFLPRTLPRRWREKGFARCQTENIRAARPQLPPAVEMSEAC